MGKVRFSGGVLIESQGSGFINIKLEMGRTGPSLVRFNMAVGFDDVATWPFLLL